MGKTTKQLVAAFALAGLAGSAGTLQAQVLSYTDPVKYDLTDNLDGTTWYQRTYNDAGWASGPAVLATDGSLNGVTVRTPLPAPSGHATYFRAHFNYSGPSSAVLSLVNRIDDGAVFYLNGVEIHRIRVNAGAVTFTTLANNQPPGGDANADDVFTYNANNLVNGDNVLAAMVLQASTGSSDITFGSEITVFSAISITQQPQSQTAQANDTVTFTVGVTGTAPRYQWQFNGNNIALATNADYTIQNVSAANAGQYRVIVSNPVNSVTSQSATLSVTTDTTPPQMVSATAQDNPPPYYILIRFDERLQTTSAVNKDNYRIQMVGSPNVQLIVSNAQVNANLVRLTVSPWTVGSNYILTVNNLADLLGNVMIPNSQIGIGFWQDVIPDFATDWSYAYGGSDPLLQSLGAACFTGLNWTTLAYNEYANSYEEPPYAGPWVVGPNRIGTPALFYFKANNAWDVNGPKNTVLGQGFPTYYFRKRFVLATNLSTSGSVRLTHLIDDGGVVYLNGEEIYRYNISGTPNCDSLASSQRGATTINPTTTGEIVVTNLLPGTNVLAAELHPQSTGSQNEPGVCFGLTMQAALTPRVEPPKLADLVVTATASPSSVSLGGNYTFTFAVTNMGNTNALLVKATNTFSSGVSVVTPLPNGCVNVGGRVECNIGTLAINAGTTRALTLQATAGGALTNRVVVGCTLDYPTSNNEAEAVVTATAATPPAITNVTMTGSNFSFTYQSITGLSYVTQYKDSLTNQVWMPFQTNVGNGSMQTIIAPNPGPSVPSRFYRVVIP